MQLYLIRHGESTNNVLEEAFRRKEATNLYDERVADAPLTNLGQTQAGKVGEHLASAVDKTNTRDRITGLIGYGITEIVCSPMLRCLQTANAIARATGLASRVRGDIYEDGAVWLNSKDGDPIICSGMTQSEMNESFPSLLPDDSITERGWWNKPRETATECAARAARVARSLQHDLADEDGRIALVSHGTFLSFLIQSLLIGEVRRQYIHVRLHNCSVSRIDLVDDRVVLAYQNKVEHLDTSEVT